MSEPSSLPLPDWVSADGPDRDVALSTRARLARNLPDLPFPHRASPHERRHVAERLQRAASAALTEPITSIRVWELAPSLQNDYIESQRISPLLADGSNERHAIVTAHGDLTLMLNEEDHLRIQAMAAGCQPDLALARALGIAERLEAQTDFAHDERLGYLTADISNVGTGLRLSVLVHLPALAFQQTLREKLRALRRIDGTVRGVHGEGTESAGSLYQVSHALTFGHEPEHYARLVAGVAHRLIVDEREARAQALQESPKTLRSLAARTQASIQEAEFLDGTTALNLVSALRLVAAVGLIPLPDAASFTAQTLLLRTSGRSKTPLDARQRALTLKHLLQTL